MNSWEKKSVYLLLISPLIFSCNSGVMSSGFILCMVLACSPAFCMIPSSDSPLMTVEQLNPTSLHVRLFTLYLLLYLYIKPKLKALLLTIHTEGLCHRECYF